MRRGKWWGPVLPVFATAAVAAALASCSSAPGRPAAPSTVAPALTWGQVARGLSPADERVLWEAMRRLVVRCMTAQGHEYRMRSWEENQQRGEQQERVAAQLDQRQRAVSDPAWARAHGYGVRTDLEEPVGANDSYPETVVRALYGTTMRTVTLPDGSPLQYGTDGCWGRAEQDLYGDLPTWVRVQHHVGNRPADVRRAAEKDAEARALNFAWSRCMRTLGWPGFAVPGDAYDSAAGAVLAEGVSAQETAAAREREKRIAHADASCQQRVRYAAIDARVRARVWQAVRSAPDPDVAVFLRMRGAAVERARQVLAGP